MNYAAMKYLMPMVLSLVASLLMSCGGGDEAPTQAAPFEATQAQLDAALIPRVENKTGPHLEQRADGSGSDTIPLNGRAFNGQVTTNPNPNLSMRSVFASVDRGSYPVGTVLAKRVYYRNADGSRGAIKGLGAMVKHPAGYFPQGGDWEYFILDPASAAEAHPQRVVEFRQLSGCASRVRRLPLPRRFRLCIY